MVTIVLLLAFVTMLFPDPTLLIFWGNQRHIPSSFGITRPNMGEHLEKNEKIDLVGTLLMYPSWVILQ